MTNPEVAVVCTGTANLASVLAGLERTGGRAYPTTDPAAVSEAPRLVLPGVGAFGAAMEALAAKGLVAALKDRLLAGRPTLAICVGFQLLFEASEESPGASGLAVLQGTVRRFPSSVRAPQFGWNRIMPNGGCRFFEPGHAYFANSYCVTAAPAGWGAAYADYGGRFLAGLERGAVLACQFHPELSGAWGRRLLRRWLDAAGAPEERRC